MCPGAEVHLEREGDLSSVCVLGEAIEGRNGVLRFPEFEELASASGRVNVGQHFRGIGAKDTDVRTLCPEVIYEVREEAWEHGTEGWGRKERNKDRTTLQSGASILGCDRGVVPRAMCFHGGRAGTFRRSACHTPGAAQGMGKPHHRSVDPEGQSPDCRR